LTTTVTMSEIKVHAFNNLLHDIVQTISEKFPEDRDLEYTRSRIELSSSVSPRTTIVSFMDAVKPYLEKIAHKDEDFFLNIAGQEKSLKDMKLNEKWNSLDDKQREKIWRKVQQMVLLGDRILTEWAN
jgi:hypothetical protein